MFVLVGVNSIHSIQTIRTSKQHTSGNQGKVAVKKTKSRHSYTLKGLLKFEDFAEVPETCGEDCPAK